MNLDNLNDRQREAVENTDGPMLILAGAGSGKTKVLTTKIAYCLEKELCSKYEILAITFTNKAAKEMKERVENILQEDVDSMWIGTFHSICSRILRVEIERIGFERNFTVYDRADQISLVKECLKDMGVDPKNVEIKNEINTISRLKNAGATEKNIDKEDFDINLSTFTMELFQKYEHKLKRYNSLDFDDLIVKTNLLFEENPDLREKYSERFKYVFVDEYQDTNDTQYKLIKNLVSKNDNICCVGDSDQSIYGWRGANIQNIQNFEKDFKNAKVILLEQNYRSTQPILDLANTVIKNNSLRKDKNLWTAKNEGDMPIYRRMYSDLDEADQVVQWIEQERYRQNPYEEMAILYRTNAQSRLFEEKLNRLGIPNRVVGGLKFYDRKEIKDCVSYLRIVENLNDNMALNRIINEPKRGIGKTTMDKLLQYSQNRGISMMEYIKNTDLPDFSNATSKKLQEFYYLIKSFPKDDLNVAELMEYILDKTGYRANLEKSTNRDDKTRLENIDEYISSLYQFVQDNPDKNLREYLETSSLMTDLDKTDDNTKGVSMMTIHAAKGLEFDVVFFTGLEEGTIPSRVDEDVEEERRLCYVAITRARKKLYITSVQSRRRFNEFQTKAESRFIEEMENKYKDESPNKEVSFRESFNTKVVDDYRTEASASITKKQNNVTKNNEKYRAGDKVSHKKFGTGVIVGIVEKDNGDELTINFDKKGLKKLNSSLAPLTRVE
ncbi:MULTISPECIES: ATP-dependent helicase [Finegoldia]|uniref:ATP-dependent helicase n=1 Tax=Finegoldia TaxID=150022 RepID=UPI0012B15B4D|nr:MULTISPECIES: UvrD-helicase domain-containing protein [Finegoldia]MBS5359892.1 UvrD-helicase domain-containing protein [Finegoldia magna]MSB11470.1 AAA family ATPase [Finegoldia sp. BIOML-A1]